MVGKQLAFFLKGLNEHNSLEFSKVHIIGFSLGAHASGRFEITNTLAVVLTYALQQFTGFAGAELKKLHRITGLDPGELYLHVQILIDYNKVFETQPDHFSKALM